LKSLLRLPGRHQAPGSTLLRLAVALLLLLAVLVLGPAGCGGKSHATDTTDPPDARTVTFPSADGVTLSGRVFGSGTRGVVLAHMYPTDQSSWYATAAELAGDGFLVLTFDFRGYGTSTGTKQIDRIAEDLHAAVMEIRTLGAEKVGLVGASMGGTAALIVAATDPVDAVVTLSAPIEFQGLSAREVVARVKPPTLFLAAEGDEGAQGARDLYRAAPEPREMELYPGTAHGTELLSGSGSEPVKARLFSFLVQHLGG
jgi:pimeloyl-ACP methyl ester carboxylesterase